MKKIKAYWEYITIGLLISAILVCALTTTGPIRRIFIIGLFCHNVVSLYFLAMFDKGWQRALDGWNKTLDVWRKQNESR